ARPPFHPTGIVDAALSEAESGAPGESPWHERENVQTQDPIDVPFLPRYCSVPKRRRAASVRSSRKSHASESQLRSDKSRPSDPWIPARSADLEMMNWWSLRRLRAQDS